MSKYGELLEQFKQATTKAGALIPQMYDALKEEGLSPEDARDRIEKDLLLFYSRRWILQCLPEEAKDVVRVNQGKKGSEVKKEQKLAQSTSANEQEITQSDGTVLLAKPGPDSDEDNPTTTQPQPESPPDTAASAPTTPSFQQEVTKGIEEKLSQKADFTAEVLQGVIEKLSSIDMEVFSVGEQVEIIDGSKCPKCWFKLHARVRKGRKLELFKAM